MEGFTTQQAKEWSELGQRTLLTIENMKNPVIAAINGYALGGGTELALACDIRVASDMAVFGTPEVRLGMIAGFGGTQRLPRLVGFGLAKEMLFTGDHYDAASALAMGLVNKVVLRKSFWNTAWIWRTGLPPGDRRPSDSARKPSTAAATWKCRKPFVWRQTCMP